VSELGVVRKYHYWSDRRVRGISTDNDISLETRWSLSLKTPPLLGGQVGISDQQRSLRRNEVARKLELAIGSHAVTDLVTPPPVRFAKGTDHIEFARFVSSYAGNEGALMHVRKTNSLGQQADICLFGSMDNFAGYIESAVAPPTGWTSSAFYAIDELIETRGQQNTSQWDDEESRAVEAMKIALYQGATGYRNENKDKPWTRGFTIGSAEATEWFAEIYVDVELSEDRWNFSADKAEYGTERILIGAPVWIRTASSKPITLYHKYDPNKDPDEQWP
jgi:hypothetical protein